MNSEFEVVTDVAEIANLNKQLAAHLSKTFRFKETREITYPSGHHTGDVYFEHKAGQNVRAWAPHVQSDKLVNFIMSGEPRTAKWMEINVQLNFPGDKYNRRIAGTFVRDSNGDIFVAHRGKLTKGHAGLRKEMVFEEFSSRLIDAGDSSTRVRLILISSLDDPRLADRLCEFAAEAREVATMLAEDSNQDNFRKKKSTTGTSKGHVVSNRPDTPSSPTEREQLLKLRDYFDEYSGEGHTKGHGGGKRTVEHGDIVKALEAQLNDRGNSKKAQAIDLAVVSPQHVDLYEVKTSARTTDVYTGVGQLLIHGECISELLGIKVRRHLVLPDHPRKEHEPHIVRKGGMRIVTFKKSKDGYCFTGLKNAKAKPS